MCCLLLAAALLRDWRRALMHRAAKETATNSISLEKKKHTYDTPGIYYCAIIQIMKYCYCFLRNYPINVASPWIISGFKYKLRQDMFVFY